MHPNIKQFANRVKERKVFPADAAKFDEWRCKQEEGSETRRDADKAWADNQSQQDASSAPTFFGADTRRAAAPQSHRGAPPMAQSAAQTNDRAAEVSFLGRAFHNPYTFLPFPKEQPIRRVPTPLTIDERPEERHRWTGVLEFEVATRSPLLTCSPEAKEDLQTKHKTYKVFSVGDDVVVPATGVKGALRTLLTVLTGGTLNYVDDEAWLVQGRDRNLGPRGKSSPPRTPEHVFLGKVVNVGNGRCDGEIELGSTVLLKADDLQSSYRRDLPRPNAGTPRPAPLYCNADGSRFADRSTVDCPWQLKLSGKPINPKGKREGAFLGSEKTVVVDKALWAAYQGRHRHGDFPELKRGDLVWLEARDPAASDIRAAADIKSLQWARWGKEGDRLLDCIPLHLRPDNLNPDGKVDVVTDLFGQISGHENAISFAARVRFGNLVFRDAVSAIEAEVALPPLQQPHPGCAAFYRAADADHVGNLPGVPLRGYKVYRNTAERGAEAPWRFETQGVYEDDGKLSRKGTRQKLNKSADLLLEDRVGKVRLSCRALTEEELGLLVAMGSVEWRLGGGKPLGLGRCEVRTVVKINEDGTREPVAPARFDQATNGFHGDGVVAMAIAAFPILGSRMSAWRAAQLPVARLRYPRALVRNNKINRGGHAWFQRHAALKKTTPGEERARGLATIEVDGGLKERAKGNSLLRAQLLPRFDPANPFSDVLYGYDLLWESEFQERNRKNVFVKADPFTDSDVRGNERSGGNQSQNRESRERRREERDR